MAETIEKTETVAVEQKSNMEDSFAKRVEELDAAKKNPPIPPLNTVKETVALLNGESKEKENGQEKQNIASPTEPQKQVETLKNEKEKIQSELKETEQQKADALKKLEDTKKSPQWWEQAEKSAGDKEVVSDESKDKELETRLNQLKAKEDAYNELLNDEFIKAIVTGKKAGKDVTAIINEIKGVDVDSISAEQLYEMDLRENNPKLTAEEITEDLEEFKSFTAAKQARETKSIREKLRLENEQRLSKYATKNEEQIQKNTEWTRQAVENTKNFIESVKETDYGIEMTPSRIEEVNVMITKGLNRGFYNKDGSYNSKFAFEQAIWAIPDLRKVIMENAYNKGVAKGKEETLLEYQRGDGKKPDGVRTPPLPVNKNRTAKEIYAEM